MPIRNCDINKKNDHSGHGELFCISFCDSLRPNANSLWCRIQFLSETISPNPFLQHEERGSLLGSGRNIGRKLGLDICRKEKIPNRRM